jgi:hypothetical protein
MTERRHFISIWFFIGIQLLIYGVLITGAEVYALFVPPAREVALASLHAGLWWGIILAVLGAVYCVKFAPGKGAA